MPMDMLELDLVPDYAGGCFFVQVRTVLLKSLPVVFRQVNIFSFLFSHIQ